MSQTPRRKTKSDWETLDHRVAFQNKKITVLNDRVRMHNGIESDYWFSRNQSASCILAENAKGEICLMREYRYPVRAALWSIPGGGMGNDQPLAAAKRELMEETGLKAKKWKLLGQTFIRPSASIDKGFIFWARELTGKTSFANQEEDESISEIRFVSWKKIQQMIRTHQIKDHWSLAAFALYAFNRK